MSHLPATLQEPCKIETDPEFEGRLKEGLRAACDWIVHLAMVSADGPGAATSTQGFPYTDWQGAIRGEYSVKSKKWGFYCPYWHSAQGAKALIAAAPHLPGAAYTEALDMMGAFLLRHRVVDPADEDKGLLLAYEDSPHTVNTSAMLESITGLFALSEFTGNPAYEAAAIGGLQWVRRRAYEPGSGLFDNSYDPVQRRFRLVSSYQTHDQAWRKRPLLDDAAFLAGYQRCGDPEMLTVFLETASRLLEAEYPQGNWIRFLPCSVKDDRIHPRHAYWWGLPLLDAWHQTHDERFRAAFLRAMGWYVQAIRRDGGLIRNTSVDFKTDSFGHATSGTACAAIVLMRAATELGEANAFPLAKKTLAYCLNMQFRNPKDPNLKGAILEKVHPPDGTDASPYHIRDLGTIFFIQAAAAYLNACAPGR